MDIVEAITETGEAEATRDDQRIGETTAVEDKAVREANLKTETTDLVIANHAIPTDNLLE